MLPAADEIGKMGSDKAAKIIGGMLDSTTATQSTLKSTSQSSYQILFATALKYGWYSIQS
jgi:hypothetical protein